MIRRDNTGAALAGLQRIAGRALRSVIASSRHVVLLVLLVVGALTWLTSRPTTEVQAQATGSYMPIATWQSSDAPLPAEAWRQAAGLAVAPDGRVFVSDADEARITVIGLDEAVTVLAVPGGNKMPLVEPRHLTIDSDSKKLYAADRGAGQVVEMGLDGSRFGSLADLPGVVGVATYWDSSVFAASATTGQVVRLDPSGSQVAAWQAAPADPNGDAIRSIATDADGLVYVVLGTEPTVRIYGPDGTLAQYLRVAPPGAPVAVFDVELDYDPRVSPDKRAWFATTRGLVSYEWRGTQWEVNPLAGDLAAVAIDRPRAKVYAATAGASPHGGRVLRLRYSGADNNAPEKTWQGSVLRLGELDGPESISIAPDGRAYVLDHGPRVQRFDLNGSPLGQLDRLNPTSVTAAPDGAMFVTDGGQIEGFPANTTWTIPRPNADWSETVEPNGGSANAVALAFDPVASDVVALDALAGRLWHVGIDGARGDDTRLRAEAGTTAVWADLDVTADGTFHVLDRGAGRVVTVPQTGTNSSIPLTDGARVIAVGGSGQLFTLARDGWVRRYDGDGVLETAFDATRFDVAQASGPSDIDVSSSGDVYVTDRDADLVTVFRWDESAQATEPPKSGAQCRNYPDKRAEPGAIDLGDTVEVRLSVRGGCGSLTSSEPRDILLVLDRSESMEGERMGVLKGAALNFVTELDYTTARVGVVSFNQEPRLESGLTDDLDRIRNAISRLDPNGQTRIDLGIAEARRELGRRGRRDAKPIFIVFSDGSSDYEQATAEADLAKQRGVEIYTVGIQAWARLMRELATDDDHYFAADSARFLYGIFERLAERIGATALFRTLTVTDEVPSNMQYVSGSAVPQAVWDPSARTLTWSLAEVPFNGLSLSYRLEPQQEGFWPTNVLAWGDYVDGFSQPGRVDFPIPYVRVGDVGPTLTPTATSTPTSTPTVTPLPPTPRPTMGPSDGIFLPLSLREERCVPGQKHADVVLVIDASSSMAGEKLVAAKAAAKQFISLLRLPDDYVAVVAFSNEVTLMSELTNDAELLQLAVDDIEFKAGTRIDLGLHVALDELESPRRNPARTAVVVLLTDGRQDDSDSVKAAASRAEDNDVQLFAIGLGADVDADLLKSIAGTGSTYLAPTPNELASIYAKIAVQVPCPPSKYWGRK